jgi:hypothetical protein
MMSMILTKYLLDEVYRDGGHARIPFGSDIPFGTIPFLQHLRKSNLITDA